MDASEIYPRRISAKETITPKKDEHFRFPTADGTAKLFFWKRPWSSKIRSDAGPTCKE